ncbi:hypothetical protein [Streptomyces cyaneofuscatus]|uniref:hypothetical protein n=1 Tax=Streptomyces cyaneofuscatus TaxID=66883 RepID=UPI00331EAC99
MTSGLQGNVDPDFLSQVRLPPVTGRSLGPVTVGEGKPEAFVNAGSTTSFVANVTGQSRQDVLDSTLFAQLGADHDWDRESETDKWYKRYQEILTHSGWVLQEFDFKKYEGSGTGFDVMGVVIDLIAALLSEQGKLVAEASINAFKALKDDDDRIVLFEQKSHGAKDGNFQLGFADETNGALTLGLGAFYFSTDETVTKILWFKFEESNSTFYQSHQTMTLNKDKYAKHARELIRDKLGKAIEKFVAGVEIDV